MLLKRPGGKCVEVAVIEIVKLRQGSGKDRQGMAKDGP